VFVHAVYFYLRKDLSPADQQRFTAGLESLRSIEGATHCWIGVPASTNRPVIERDYDRALVLVFPDQTAHDVYQDHPVHDRFRKECASFWTKVRIFDSVSQTDVLDR
jgi:hypothetical protein